MSAADNGTERSLGQLVATATAEMSALMHDEIALAKAEFRRTPSGRASAVPRSRWRARWRCSRCRY